jgi:hypothetical protein
LKTKPNQTKTEKEEKKINGFEDRGRSWPLVAHAYNPSYSGSRDQKDHSSKLAPGK